MKEKPTGRIFRLFLGGPFDGCFLPIHSPPPTLALVGVDANDKPSDTRYCEYNLVKVDELRCYYVTSGYKASKEVVLDMLTMGYSGE